MANECSAYAQCIPCRITYLEWEREGHCRRRRREGEKDHASISSAYARNEQNASRTYLALARTGGRSVFGSLSMFSICSVSITDMLTRWKWVPNA